MREFVLNDASIAAADQRTAIDWLADIAKGMSSLVVEKIAQNTLRTSRSLQEIHYRENSSLWEVILALKQQDERLFLMRSIVKSPLTNELEQSVKDRFPVCEGRSFPSPVGNSLVLCAISDRIAVSFPSDSVWNSDLIKVDFYELHDDESSEVSEEETFEEIDNLARSNHAPPLYDAPIPSALNCADNPAPIPPPRTPYRTTASHSPKRTPSCSRARSGRSA